MAKAGSGRRRDDNQAHATTFSAPTSAPSAAAGAARFPAATPLNAFFAWNEARRACDRRYLIASDVLHLLARFGDGAAGRALAIAHLSGAAIIGWRGFGRVFVSKAPGIAAAPPREAARRLVDSLLASLGSADIAAHAAVFSDFETLAAEIDLDALARRRPRAKPAVPAQAGPRRILIVKLGALGDFVQALGPVPAIRRRHGGDRLTLLTTAPYADFAERTGLFDAVLVDRRPRWFDVAGWLALALMLRRGRFDRVYDLQTSDRSNAYAWLLRRSRMPEWSGIAWRCSHPHANRDRDRQHTLDRQAEQLLMAGVYPVPRVEWLPPVAAPIAPIKPPFALLIPGSSAGRPEKRWPAARYGALANRLCARGCVPVVVGVAGEEAIARAIRDACPEAVDLVGRTGIVELAALARAAALTIGNDSGATHVAAAGGNPVVVLFSRASAPELCAPRGPQVRVLVSRDLADLSLDEVDAAAAAALADANAAAG